MKRLCGWWLTPFAVSLRLHPAMFSTEQCFFHGGLTPPALTLQCEHLSAKKRFLRCTNAHSSQERWASARRGIEKRVCNGGRFSRCDYVCHGTPRFRTTAGLRQPLLVVRRQLVVYARLRFATVFCFPRGAYAPRSCCSANVCRRKKRFLRCANAHSQERRASARRGV
jgi:hypothetical protein